MGPRQNLPRYIQFRILIIGRANAGKTTILQRVCDTTKSPEVDRVDRERGGLCIEDEFVFANHRGCTFHNSGGFESVSDNLEVVQDHVLRKSQKKRMNKQKLRPTLYSWLKNMNKLSNLIDRVEELAAAAPSDYRPQLHRQVATLRATFKRQQERYIEFLRLTEEYANRYLLDISAEIRQQSSFLDMLEKRLDMAKTLHGQAVDLRNSHESGTVNAMKKVRQTVLSQPLPEDLDLLGEIDFLLGEVRRCYKDMEKFWTEEICRAVKALKTWRIDPDDVEQWKDFKGSLVQTIESWKTHQHGRGIWSTTRNNPDSSGADLGAIASSLSPALSVLEEGLQRIRESASMEFSNMNLAGGLLQIHWGLTRSSRFCLDFFRLCVDFGDMIVTSSSVFIAYPAFSRTKASNDLRDRVMALGREDLEVDASMEIVTQSQGLRKFNSAYKQSLSLQQEMTLGLNSFLESVSSWVALVDDIPDVQPGYLSLKLLRNLADTWVKGRASIRTALASLTDDPAERLRCRSLSLTSPSPHPRSSIAQWVLGMVCFS